MAYATTFRHSATPEVRGRELDANLDALGVYVDGTFLPLTGGTITGTLTVTGTLAINGAWDGWIGANETWTYASATTFTVASDVTSKYRVGDKIKLTQTTAKYFYLVAISYSAPNTTITVTGGTDFTLANAAITSPFYSKLETPQGFPNRFAFTPVFANLGTVTVGQCYFSFSGKTLGMWINATTGTVVAGICTMTLPGGLTHCIAAATAQTGKGTRNAANGDLTIIADSGATGSVGFAPGAASATPLTRQNGSVVFGNTEFFSFFAMVPIS